jgi:hypothetical protein
VLNKSGGVYYPPLGSPANDAKFNL